MPRSGVSDEMSSQSARLSEQTAAWLLWSNGDLWASQAAWISNCGCWLFYRPTAVTHGVRAVLGWNAFGLVQLTDVQLHSTFRRPHGARSQGRGPWPVRSLVDQ